MPDKQVNMEFIDFVKCPEMTIDGYLQKKIQERWLKFQQDELLKLENDVLFGTSKSEEKPVGLLNCPAIDFNPQA